MAKISKQQKATVELMDYILTWCEDNNEKMDPHTAEKLAGDLINNGYRRIVCRKQRLITYKGKTKRLAEWSRICGIHQFTLLQRLRRGWNIEDALTVPVDTRRGSGNFRPVNQLDEKGNVINTYPSITAAAEAMGCNIESIASCCKGKTKTAYGYRWKYADEKKESRRK